MNHLRQVDTVGRAVRPLAFLTAVAMISVSWLSLGAIVLSATVLSATVLSASGCSKIIIPDLPLTEDVVQNAAPIFDSVDLPLAVEGVQWQIDLDASDPEGGTVTFELGESPQGMTLDQGGLLTWTPGSDVVTEGEETTILVTVIARDDGEPSAEVGEDLIVRIANNADDDSIPDSQDPDDDNDGLLDTDEVTIGSDPKKADTDDDGTNDPQDNCPIDSNSDQKNSDDDEIGDACDTDDDNDGVDDVTPDNCLLIANTDQLDTDEDGAGNECDDDDDDDEHADQQDNCPLVPNTDQANLDEDPDGDACDDDIDNDNDLNLDDNCPKVANSDQLDTDGDLAGDMCDDDDDGDAVADMDDNCPLTHNPLPQPDQDTDGFGDACDICPEDKANSDGDEDGVCDDSDNCPGQKNADQTNTDLDEDGDVCDDDDDNDGIDDDEPDNCPLHANSDQLDTDQDDLGNVCDPDDDDDGHLDGDDNCQLLANPDQLDTDLDGEGDICDDDDDNDTILDLAPDNCPLTPNTGQLDTDADDTGDVCDDDDDNDGVPDASDNCPLTANPAIEGIQADCNSDGVGDACSDDDDGDAVLDPQDNCICAPNPLQKDLDGDQQGDACDLDDDGDGVLDDNDNCPLTDNPGQADVDLDGLGTACDAVIQVLTNLTAEGGNVNVDGDARNGLVALQFRNTAVCEDFAPDLCAAPSLLVLDSNTAHQDAEFIGVTPLGQMHSPAASDQGVALYPGIKGNGTEGYLLSAETAGAAEVLDGSILVGAPQLTRAWDGSFIASLATAGGAKQYRVGHAGAPALLQSAASFEDSFGAGIMAADDKTLYAPFVTKLGKFGLGAYSEDSSYTTALSGFHEIARLGADSATDGEWYCSRKTSTFQPEVARFIAGVEGASTILPSGPPCANLEWTQQPDGVMWFWWSDGSKTSIQRWTPGSTAPALNTEVDGASVTVHVSGDETYFVWACPTDSCVEVGWFDGGQVVTLASAQGYGHLATANSDGQLAMAWRTKKTGASDIQVMVADKLSLATAVVANSSTSPTMQNIWVTPDRVAWIQVLGNFGASVQSRLFSAALLSGQATAETAEQFIIAGQARLDTLGGITLLSVDGPDKGLYQVSGDTTILLAESVGLHAVVATSDGVPWLSWPVAGGSWTLGHYTASPAPALAISATGLEGPPLVTVYEPSTDRDWLQWDDLDGSSSVGWLEGDDLSIWQTSNVPMTLVLRPQDAGEDAKVFGVRIAESDGWTWCEEASGACWTMPTTNVLAWWAVDPQGTVHAVYFDGGSAWLWRNLGEL